MQDTQVQSLAQEDPLEKEMATHSSIPAWKIPWTEEPGGLQSMGSWRVGHDWMTKHMLNGMFQASAVFSMLFTLTGMVSSSFYLFFQTQVRNDLLQEVSPNLKAFLSTHTASSPFASHKTGDAEMICLGTSLPTGLPSAPPGLEHLLLISALRYLAQDSIGARLVLALLL